MRIGFRVPLLIAALGLGSMLVVRSGWANYILERYNYGESVTVSGQCFDLPFGWTVIPGGRSDVTDVRRHFVGDGPETFASVLPMSLVSGLHRSGSLLSPNANGFALYDLGPTSPGGPIRYIALNEPKAVALTAARDELMRALAMELTKCK